MGNFKLVANRAQLLSALDFSDGYVRVILRQGFYDLEGLDIQIGQHEFDLPIKGFLQDKCGGYIFHLPRISANY